MTQGMAALAAAWLVAGVGMGAGTVGVSTATHLPDEQARAAATFVAAADSAPSIGCCEIAAGTVLQLEILDTLDSSRHQRGDVFALRITEPLSLDGHLLIPAGTSGQGQVIHAAKARGGGKPGELLVAARFLDHGGTQIPLRGLQLVANGDDRSGAAIGTASALVVAAPIAAPLAMFIRGGQIVIPAGTRAQAKTAATVFVAAGDTQPPTPTEANPTQPEQS